jgi:hypothetical protein
VSGHRGATGLQGRSEPHVHALLQLTLSPLRPLHRRAAIERLHDSRRDTGTRSKPCWRRRNWMSSPRPRPAANALQCREMSGTGDASEFGEWPPLLGTKFPQLRRWDDRIVRLAQGSSIRGLHPQIAPGSWLLLEQLTAMPDTRSDWSKKGWSRPLYVLRRGDRDVLRLSGAGWEPVRAPHHSVQRAMPRITFDPEELGNFGRVTGVAVPV